MKSIRWAPLLLVAIVFLGPHLRADKRTQIAKQSRGRITSVSRALTAETWATRIDEVLAATPEAKGLGPKWTPTAAQWHKASEEMLGLVMKRFDDLHDAPEAIERMELPFARDLSEAQATEVLALGAVERAAVDDFADALTLSVESLERHPGLKIGSEEYRQAVDRLSAAAKIPPVRDVPKVHLGDETMRAYRQARSSSVTFYVTAMDGQLQLYFFDHLDAMKEIATSAARAAGRGK